MNDFALLRRFASPWRGPLDESADPESVVLATGSGIEIVGLPAHDGTAHYIADIMLARYESDVALLCRVFGVARPQGLRITLRELGNGLAAAHREHDIYCDLPEGTGLSAPHPLRCCHELASQLVEILGADQDAGWDARSAHGEALSRVLAGSLYPGWRVYYPTGRWWHDAGRPDVITSRIDTDDDPVAVGASTVFLNYLHDGLGYDWTSIVHAGAPTLAETYRRLTGRSEDPFPAFRRAVDSVPVEAKDPHGENPFPVAGAAPLPRPAPRTLESPLAHRRWWLVRTPMCHVRAEDVFVQPVYDGLVTRFRERLAAGDFSRSLPGYDASAAAVTRENAGAFSVFLSREWHDMIARIFGINATGEVNVTLHHHAPDSASGTLHNDLNPGWFARPTMQAVAGEITVSDPAECNYRTGKSIALRETVERVRAIGLIYYLDTPAEVLGGGTGLYRAGQSLATPDVVVPPKNNSLVAFECTPFSFHSFISNVGAPRNCVAMWLHRDKQDVLDRWGAGAIVGWS